MAEVAVPNYAADTVPSNYFNYDEAPDLETFDEPDKPQTGKTPTDCKHERIQGYVYKLSGSARVGYVRSEMYDGEIPFTLDEMMQEFVNHKITLGEKVEFTLQNEEGSDRHVATLLKPIVNRSAYECLGNRYRGYIRRFAERWGFLNSAAFDGDLFVHRDNLLPQPEFATDQTLKDIPGQSLLAPRQLVEFDVMLDERGRAVAKFITTKVPSTPSDWLGLRVRGHIRSFQDRWGFLNSDRFLGDLFIHRDGLMNNVQNGSLGPGTVVEFDVEMDNHRSRGPRNRLVARNVVLLQLPNGEIPGNANWSRDQQNAMGFYNNGPNYQGGHQDPYGQYGGHLGGGPAYPGGGGGYNPNMHSGGPGWGAPPGHHHQPPPYGGGGGAGYGGPSMPPGGGLQSVNENKEEEWDWQSGGPDKSVSTHITIKDWEADGQGQLRASKGQLITVSHEAPHGWVYATHLKLPDENKDVADEGWIPKVMVKRVNLCQAVCDWPGEGGNSTTLSVRKNEWVAISREADRGWVYGDRVVTETNSIIGGGWIPKKILQ